MFLEHIQLHPDQASHLWSSTLPQVWFVLHEETLLLIFFLSTISFKQQTLQESNSMLIFFCPSPILSNWKQLGLEIQHHLSNVVSVETTGDQFHMGLQLKERGCCSQHVCGLSSITGNSFQCASSWMEACSFQNLIFRCMEPSWGRQVSCCHGIFVLWRLLKKLEGIKTPSD